jgi:hypothetical protein
MFCAAGFGGVEARGLPMIVVNVNAPADRIILREFPSLAMSLRRFAEGTR